MPYISASIIFQLLGTVVPSLEKLQKEGETGRKKIQEWTRYATVPLCMIQAIFWLSYMHNTSAGRCGADRISHGTTSVLADGHLFAHRRLHLPDVARRADRRIRPGQRHRR